MFFKIGNDYQLKDFKNENQLSLGLFYKIQVTESTNMHIINPLIEQKVYHYFVYYNFLNFSLSYQF